MSTSNKIPFINLHAHTTMSYFDGLCFPYEHYKCVAEKNEDAMAITDHGNMNALPYQLEAQKKIEKEFGFKFKSIFGNEFYYVPSLKEWRKEYEEYKKEKKETKKKVTSDDENEETGVYIEDDEESKGAIKKITSRRYHLVLLAQNQRGLNNLFRLTSESHQENNFFKYPRIDFELIKKYNEGLLCSTACIGNYFMSIYHQNKRFGHDVIIEKMRDEAQKFLDVFGDKRFFGELQWNKIPEQHILNQYIIQLSQEMGFKCITTCDSHYPGKQYWKDREIYKRLGWISKALSKLPDYIKKEIPTTIDELDCELFPKSGEEVWQEYKKTSALFQDNYYDDEFILESIKRTKEIAIERIETFLPENSIKLPNFLLKKDEKEEITLTKMCIEGLKKRGLETKKEYVERLKRELKIIKSRDFSRYFIVMKEISDRASKHMTCGVGRGCFLPDTRVCMKEGKFSLIQNINPKDEIIDMNRNFQKVLERYEYNIEEEIVVLELENGKIIKCTQDHLFFTLNRGWVEAKNLTEKDELKII